MSELSQDHKEALEDYPQFLHRYALLYERLLESKRASNMFIITGIICAAIGLVVIGYFSMQLYAPGAAARAQRAVQASANAPMVFQCLAGKSIRAIIEAGSARIELSDGRQIILPETGSGEGSRFSNPDQSFVFWNEGNAAYIMENGVESFKDCAGR